MTGDAAAENTAALKWSGMWKETKKAKSPCLFQMIQAFCSIHLQKKLKFSCSLCRYY